MHAAVLKTEYFLDLIKRLKDKQNGPFLARVAILNYVGEKREWESFNAVFSPWQGNDNDNTSDSWAEAKLQAEFP